MKTIASAILITALGISSGVTLSMQRDPLAPSGMQLHEAQAPVNPITETLWGTRVTDNYRYMEALAPSTVAWIKAQGDYTRSVLDSIPPRVALEAKIAAFTGSFGL